MVELFEARGRDRTPASSKSRSKKSSASPVHGHHSLPARFRLSGFPRDFLDECTARSSQTPNLRDLWPLEPTATGPFPFLPHQTASLAPYNNANHIPSRSGIDMKLWSRSRLNRTTNDVVETEEEAKLIKGKRTPVCLRIRSSTWWIALCVGFGGECPLKSSNERTL